MTSRRRQLVLAALAVWMVGASLTAQTPSRVDARQEPTPTFRAGVKLIDLDVYVTDKDGQFVKDLTRDDFEIIEDGKPQELQAFTFVDLPVPTVSPIPLPSTPEPDVVTNAGIQGRLYVFLLDSPSTARPPGQEFTSGVVYAELVKRVARRFVDEYLQPGDMAAVVHVQGTFTDSQTFTSSKELLKASIDRYGRGLSGDNDTITPDERARRHLDTYRAIEDVANRLGAITGRRKAILWIGAQMHFDVSLLPPQGVFVPAAHRDAIGAATRSNVAVYAIDPSGLQAGTGPEELSRAAALRVVAEDTGGLTIVNTNNFRDGFTNVVRDNSTYYVLGYVPSIEYRDGKFHQVTVRVKRPGRYTVRQRKGYTAPAPDTQATDRQAAPVGASAATREALRLPVPLRGLSLSLFSAAFKGDAKDQSVVIGGTIAGDLQLDGAQQVGLAYQVFTVENRVQVGEYKTFTLNLRAGSRAKIASGGLHFVDRVSLPPGRYEIRYVVDQPGGHIGSVVAPLTVPKFDEALSISGVVLASDATADDVMLREDEGIRERLGANPTSARVFHRGDLVNALVEVYSDDARVTEDDLMVTGELATVDGREVARGDARLRSAERPDDGRWAYTVEFELDDVPAGSYVLKVEATSTRHKEPIRRQVPIIVEE